MITSVKKQTPIWDADRPEDGTTYGRLVIEYGAGYKVLCWLHCSWGCTVCKVFVLIVSHVSPVDLNNLCTACQWMVSYLYNIWWSGTRSEVDKFVGVMCTMKKMIWLENVNKSICLFSRTLLKGYMSMVALSKIRQFRCSLFWFCSFPIVSTSEPLNR